MGSVYENIRAIRLQKGLNQQDIAEALDIDPAAVSRIESGKRDIKVSELPLIARVLGVEVHYLITYPEVMSLQPSSDPAGVTVTFTVNGENQERLFDLLREILSEES